MSHQIISQFADHKIAQKSVHIFKLQSLYKIEKCFTSTSKHKIRFYLLFDNGPAKQENHSSLIFQFSLQYRKRIVRLYAEAAIQIGSQNLI